MMVVNVPYLEGATPFHCDYTALDQRTRCSALTWILYVPCRVTELVNGTKGAAPMLTQVPPLGSSPLLPSLQNVTPGQPQLRSTEMFTNGPESVNTSSLCLGISNNDVILCVQLNGVVYRHLKAARPWASCVRSQTLPSSLPCKVWTYPALSGGLIAILKGPSMVLGWTKTTRSQALLASPCLQPPVYVASLPAPTPCTHLHMPLPSQSQKSKIFIVLQTLLKRDLIEKIYKAFKGFISKSDWRRRSPPLQGSGLKTVSISNDQ